MMIDPQILLTTHMSSDHIWEFGYDTSGNLRQG